MPVFSGIVLYVVIWWLVLFVVLPWGVRPPDHVEPGHATGAPERPRLWFKAGITTAVSTVLWLICYWLITRDVFLFLVQ